MLRTDALRIANELVDELRPACTRIEIAGSIRRGKAEPRDIEIVAVPDLTPLPRLRAEFGKPVPVQHKTRLDKIVTEWDAAGRVHLKANGEKYKKIWMARESIQLDLFLVTPPAEWGVQMVIRTGPSEFSHWCVTRRKMGGALPDQYIVEDGCVGERAQTMKGDARRSVLPMAEEIDFLNFLGLGWIEPGQREAKWQRWSRSRTSSPGIACE